MSEVPEDPEGAEDEDLEDPKDLENPNSKAKQAKRSLLFSAASPMGGALQFRGTPSEIETDQLSDSVWEMIQSGEIIQYLPPYLLPTDATNALNIEPNDENRCDMIDNNVKPLAITRNEENGSLGFIVDTSKKGGSINPIRLMIATAKCASMLDVEIRMKRMLGGSPTEDEKKKAREKILTANPKLQHLTINTCASAKDVALMLLEMRGKPPFEATLTPNVIAAVQKEMGKLSLEHRNIIQEQLAKQEPVPPSVSKPPGF